MGLKKMVTMLLKAGADPTVRGKDGTPGDVANLLEIKQIIAKASPKPRMMKRVSMIISPPSPRKEEKEEKGNNTVPESMLRSRSSREGKRRNKTLTRNSREYSLVRGSSPRSQTVSGGEKTKSDQLTVKEVFTRLESVAKVEEAFLQRPEPLRRLQAVARGFIARRRYRRLVQREGIRGRIVHALLDCEADYVQTLNTFYSHFIKPLKDNASIPRQIKDASEDLFVHLEEIRNTCIRLAFNVQSRVNGWKVNSQFADVYNVLVGSFSSHTASGASALCKILASLLRSFADSHRQRVCRTADGKRETCCDSTENGSHARRCHLQTLSVDLRTIETFAYDCQIPEGVSDCHSQRARGLSLHSSAH